MREFPPFRLDTVNQCLWRGDGAAEERILLAPRAFAVLRYLVEHPGRLVAHDELLEALWPKTYVQPEVLKTHVAAIRAVLGDDARKPIFIETLSRRGYRFIAPVTEGGLASHAAARESSATAATPAGPPPSRTTNLPEAVSELIGREAELGQITALVTEHRLVSLVGAGGIGKTRLGLEVGRHLLPRFADGVFVAELGSLSSAELVPATVASALGLTHVAHTLSDEGVAGAVGTKKLLLVIDNCEHVIEAAARMAEALLRASPDVSLLATSREPLRVSGECVYRVPSLDVPAEDPQDMEDVFRYGAVRLFVLRAHAAEPRYVAEGPVLTATAAICRRLDGIPLAIELAATRIAGFGVAGVAARLDDRFRLLTGGSRTLARQQTMRATLDWSYDLLPESERVVLRRLGVFVGPFTMDAASAVAAGVDIPASEVADSVANLVGKSLVSTDVGGAIVYYRLLETTRAYAGEKLIESAEFDHVAQRHADDLRAALDWAFSRSGDVGVGVALAAATAPLWTYLSLLTECRARVEQAIAALGRQVPSDPRRDVRLYLALGHVLLQNRQASARPGANAALTKALELAEITDDGRYRLAALHGLYLARFFTGEYRNALNLAEKFRTVAADTAARSDVPIGNLLIGLTLHVLGDQPGARRHLEPLVGSHFVTARPSHISLYQYDQRVILECYYARVLWLQGFGDQARRLTEKLVDYARTNDHRRSFLYTLLHAACPIAVFVGDLATVEHHVRLAFNLAARHAIEMWNGWAQCFEGVVLIKRGESHAGSQLLQSALERLPALGFHHHVSLLLPELAAGLGGAGQIAEGLVVADTALARLWRGQQRVEQARKLLAPVYRRFTEGFATADLIAAKSLLAQFVE